MGSLETAAALTVVSIRYRTESGKRNNCEYGAENEKIYNV